MNASQYTVFTVLLFLAAILAIVGGPVSAWWWERRATHRQFTTIATLNTPLVLDQAVLKAHFFCLLDQYRDNIWYWVQCLRSRLPDDPFTYAMGTTDQRVKMVRDQLDAWLHDNHVTDFAARNWLLEWARVQDVLGESEVYGWGINDDTRNMSFSPEAPDISIYRQGVNHE